MAVEFDEFVAATRSPMQRLALALTGGDRSEAEDLVQSALERIWNRWDRGQILEPTAYARRVLVREFTTARRRVRWSRERLMSDVPDRQRDDFSRLSDEADLLLRALAALPRRQREVVVLRYVEDLPIAEVAALLSCSEGNVKRSAHDGLQHLRVHLDQSMERS